MIHLKWYNVTCAKSWHIIKAQQWLFEKYVGEKPIYLNVGSEPIENWGKKVASLLPNDEYLIFGLDDYLPIDHYDWTFEHKILTAMDHYNIERFELGWGASKKKGFIEHDNLLLYGDETPYKVSCQFSVWKTEALRRELENTTTPWKFEVKGYAKAACYKKPVFRWIEESALSSRQENKINVLGLRPSDRDKLQELGYFKYPLIYGWTGSNVLSDDKGGAKYAEFYETEY